MSRHTRQFDYQCQRCHEAFDLERAIYRQGYHHCPECGSDHLAENVTLPVRYLMTGRYRITRKKLEIAA
jgi:putative FmdB family regulatory protein